MDSPIEADPAAEFLAQEKEALGDIMDDFEITPEVGSGPSEVSGAPLDAPSSTDEIPAAEEDPHPPLGSSGGPSPPAMSSMSLSKPVPETIRRWREENEQLLKEKDEKEEVMKEELKEKAAKELEDWYKNYQTQLKSTQESNRGSEKDFIAEVNDIAPGTEWERVHKLCDFNSKTNRNSKDMSRMRHILLQLKQTGVKVN